MSQLIEFIESYKKIGNDYQWNDNHGELVRCKDCIHKEEIKDYGYNGESLYLCKKEMFSRWACVVFPTDYCSRAERKEE